MDYKRRVTGSGTMLGECHVRTDSGIYNCVFWDDDVLRFGVAFKEGGKIHIEGYVSGENNVTAKWFHSLAKPEVRSVRADIQASDVPKGFVKVPITKGGVTEYIARPLTECINIGGRWRDRMEFVTDTLGSPMVEGTMREIMRDGFNARQMKFAIGALVDMAEEVWKQQNERDDETERRSGRETGDEEEA